MSMEDKRTIRKRVLALRDALSPEARVRSEVLVTERVLGHQWYYRAEELLLFQSYGSEINMEAILEDALRLGKKVYLPVVLGENMEFFRVQKGDVLETGYKGIMEPNPKGREKFCYSEEKLNQVLMIMPGVAFDCFRNRIGYGKGFYDRYLKDKTAMHTIAVGFDCQMVSVIESDETDIKPMQVFCL